MKLKIYDGKPRTEDKPLYLKFVEESGDIKVIACNSRGILKDGGYLIGFTSDGKIYRMTAVGRELGFVLDSNGRIKVK